MTRCSLQEQDMDTSSVGSLYLLKNFEVHKFASKKFITKAKHGCEIIPIPDIGDIANRPTIKLLFLDDDQHSHCVFVQTFLDIAKAKDMDETTEELFLQLPPFTSIKFNKK